jgi:hypothetical protein
MGGRIVIDLHELPGGEQEWIANQVILPRAFHKRFAFGGITPVGTRIKPHDVIANTWLVRSSFRKPVLQPIRVPKGVRGVIARIDVKARDRMDIVAEAQEAHVKAAEAIVDAKIEALAAEVLPQLHKLLVGEQLSRDVVLSYNKRLAAHTRITPALLRRLGADPFSWPDLPTRNSYIDEQVHKLLWRGARRKRWVKLITERRRAVDRVHKLFITSKLPKGVIARITITVK